MIAVFIRTKDWFIFAISRLKNKFNAPPTRPIEWKERGTFATLELWWFVFHWRAQVQNVQSCILPKTSTFLFHACFSCQKIRHSIVGQWSCLCFCKNLQCSLDEEDPAFLQANNCCGQGMWNVSTVCTSDVSSVFWFVIYRRCKRVHRISFGFSPSRAVFSNHNAKAVATFLRERPICVCACECFILFCWLICLL